MTQYMYRDYIVTLSKRFTEAFTTIETEHAYEYGDEFELALCKVLRTALPARYGICRGYAVDQFGETKGDDILIYEHMRFPTLALREQDYSRVEFVPIEAIYAYIEVKHTLNIEGDDPQSLQHALQQVGGVKSLISTREPVPPSRVSPYLNIDKGFTFSVPNNHPEIKNQAFGVIFARQVRRKKGQAVLSDPKEISECLVNSRGLPVEKADIIIAGEHNVILPGKRHELNPDIVDFTPFRGIKGAQSIDFAVPGKAYAIGLLSIMTALDWIELGTFPYRNIIADAINKRPRG